VKTEAPVDKAELIQALWRAYGVGAASLTFLPTDWGAYNYVVDCAGGERFFLKLLDDAATAGVAASSRDFYVPLTYELHTKGILPRVPHPLLTVDGQLCMRFGPYWLVLDNYIEGMTIGFGNMPDPVLPKLARLVGILHRSTQQLTLRNPFVDDFGIPFKAELLQILDRLPEISSDATQSAQELRDLLLPQRASVLTHLQRLESLGAMARECGRRVVVCHTDLHGGNLIVDGQGQLYIVDWENAILAPPEHDLFMFADDDRFGEIFVPNYEAEYGPMDLDGEHLSFYTYRRVLEDLTAYFARILRGDGGATQDQADLEEIAAHLAGLPHVETRMAKILEREV
jgi:Ser/Thr protein kinase RdoA (MazF antagonist)